MYTKGKWEVKVRGKQTYVENDEHTIAELVLPYEPNKPNGFRENVARSNARPICQLVNAHEGLAADRDGRLEACKAFAGIQGFNYASHADIEKAYELAKAAIDAAAESEV